MKIVVIGGVAAGMSAASQAKRRSPDAEVVVFERGEDVSYGACGMPYNIEDPDRRPDDLVVITAKQFREKRGIDVRTGHEAVKIDRQRKVVVARDLENDRTVEEPYDKLVIATGARAARPPLPGLESPGVFLLRELQDARHIKRWIENRKPKRAVVVGAGYIGMEMAEAFRALGLEVTVLEKMGQILPGFEGVVAEKVHEELDRHDVNVQCGVTVEEIRAEDDGSLVVQTHKSEIPTDLVLVSVGVRPNSEIARDAGITLGHTGAIAVDDHQRTSDPDVYAAGDCAEAYHLLTRQGAYVPLGTTANKQGKVAGANVVGADERFGGIVGTAGFKVFDLEVGRTGLGDTEIEDLDLDAVIAVSEHSSRAHGYPDPKRITTILFAENGTGRLLGAQMVGGDAVAKRVDVFATALHAGMTVEQVESLDLSYAPPFAPVWDPILIAAGVTRKALEKAVRSRNKARERRETERRP